MSPILQNHYVLAVHDARRSADFYVRVLGFRVVDEPPGWIFVAKDGCMIMLGECPDDMAASELGCHSYFAYLFEWPTRTATSATLRPKVLQSFRDRRQGMGNARV